VSAGAGFVAEGRLALRNACRIALCAVFLGLFLVFRVFAVLVPFFASGGGKFFCSFLDIHMTLLFYISQYFHPGKDGALHKENVAYRG